MLEFIVLLSLIATVYAYFGYPLALYVCNSFGIGPRSNAGPIRAPETASSGKQQLSSGLIGASPSGDAGSTVGIVITVRNEARVIRAKLDATFELLYRGKTVRDHLLQQTGAIQLLVASDASDDGTNEAVLEFEKLGVELLVLKERGGKETAQREAVQHMTTDFIVFTDAKIALNSEALDNFVAYFRDESVGAVSSVDQIISDSSASSGEGFYVRYEMWLRSEESEFNSLVGMSGSCFAVRRTVAEHIRTDVPSDFALLIQSVKLGMRGVNAPDVIGSYKAVKTEQEEFARKVRTVLRGITALFVLREVMNPNRYGYFAWQVISHKLMRWLVPWFLIVAFFGSFLLSFSSVVFLYIFVGMGLFFGAASWAWRNPSLQTNVLFKVPLFFCVVNAAIASAWLKYLSGQRSVAWNPSEKGGTAG